MLFLKEAPLTEEIAPLRAQWLVFAHTTDVAPLTWNEHGFVSPTRGQGRLGEHVADYVIRYADGSEARERILRRHQVAMVQRDYLEVCFQAVAQAKPRAMLTRNEQPSSRVPWGASQTRVSGCCALDELALDLGESASREGDPRPSGRAAEPAYSKRYSILTHSRGSCTWRSDRTQYNHASGDPRVAMRIGDWKILATLDRNPVPRSNDLTEAEERDFKEAKLDKFSLYNLRRDIGETRDLAAEQPAKFAELKSQLEKKYLEVRAESPTWPAWKFTYAEEQRIEWPDYVKKPAKK